jgi:hypothetical protein
MRLRCSAVLAAGLTLLGSGCSIEKLAADNMAPILLKVKDEFNRETVVQYGREAAPGLLGLLNGVVLASPDNAELRLIEAEMNASFAFAFLETENPAWATVSYQRAQRAALAALADVDEDLAAGLATMPLDGLSAALLELDEDAVGALFWWGFGRGSEVNLHRDDPKLILSLDRVDLVMQWVVDHDEAYFNAGPHLFFAIRHTLLPATLGGKPEIGLEHFEAVDRLTHGKMLLAKVFRAQYFAPSLAATKPGADMKTIKAAQMKAWKAFYDTLAEVMEAPDDLWPEQSLSNAVAKQKAQVLLKDPESYNIIPPEGVTNPYATGSAGDTGGDWDDGGDDAGGDWGDGDWGGK